MKVTVEHHSGRLETYTIPSPDEIRAFKDALQPIVEFFNQDPPAPSFSSEDGYIEETEKNQTNRGGIEMPCEGLVMGTPEEVAVDPDDDDDDDDDERAIGGNCVTTENPRCFLCGDIIEADDSYCYGCRTFICPEHPQTPWGRHLPKMHDEP